jgi:hypothetical protein
MFDSVPERYINVIAGIEQFFDLKTIAFDEAVGRLKAFEERTRRETGGSRSDIGQLLLTRAEWEARQKKVSGEGSGGGRGHGSTRGRGHGRGGGSSGRGSGDVGKEGTGRRDKSHIKCFKCKNYGHYANRCPGEARKEEEAHHVKRVDYEPAVLMDETIFESGQSEQLLSEKVQTKKLVYLHEAVRDPELLFTGDGESSEDLWYLDNGASNHMSGNRHKFRDLDTSIGGKVRFGDGSSVEIHGRGSMLFQGLSGEQWILYDVYFIPKLKRNLISLGQLTEIGYRVEMDEYLIKVTDKKTWKIIMRVQRAANRLYMIVLKSVEPVSFLASVGDQSWLWHGRL